MGRFYKTATPQKLDFMHKLPEGALLQAINATDQRLANEEAAIYDLYGQLEANALSKDKTRRDEILKEYEGQVDELAGKFMEDPLSYSNTKGQTRKLARTIHEDWTRGEVSSIQGNFNTRTEFAKRYKEAIAAGKEGYNAKDFETAMAYFDANFEGTKYDKELGAGNAYTPEELSKYINMEDLAEVRGEGYIADAVKNLGAYRDGDYIYTSVNSKEGVDPNVIREGVKSAMMNDQELKDYLLQQAKFGRYGDDPAAAIDEMLNAAADRVAEKYGYEKTEQGKTSMKGDPFALKRLGNELAKDLHGWKKNFDNVANMPVDRNNEELEYNIFGGAKTKEDLTTKTKNLEESNAQKTQTLKNNLYDKIVALQDSGKLDSEGGTEMFNAVNKAVENGDWSTVEDLYVKAGIGTVDSEGNVIGTGIQETVDIIQMQQTQIDNYNQTLTALETNVGEKLDQEFAQQKANATSTLNKSIDDLDAQIKKMGTTEGLSVKEAIAKNNKIRELQRQRDEKVKDRDGLTKKMQENYEKQKTQKVEAGVNSIMGNEDVSQYYQSVYSTAGNWFDQMGIDDVQKGNYMKQLESAGKNLFEALSNSSNAYIEYEAVDDSGKRTIERISYNQLVQKNLIQHEEIKALIEGDEGETVKRMEGGKEITFKKGDMRQSPYTLPNVGRWAYQQTIVGTDPETGKPRTYTFYVPQSDLLPTEDVYKIQQKALPIVLTEELELEATRAWQNLFQKGEVTKEQAFTKSKDTGVKYSPFINGGKWEFTTAKGDVKIMYGDAGRQMNKRILEGKYGEAKLDGTELKGTNLNKGSGGYSSTTTSKTR